ncbi:aldehyde dehydrogenase [Alicyclobacillus mali]|uniref:Aldehyde dehydrogenase n=1 Tax=Alicyclobacillus mali (ex Roth et al. 2021) TaxID=1123961 RepID=A0ABS0F2Y5_9BACL|nr:aldehyde dehydrogenase family protein [Alicyclobacillus mali (ex Roth et al. 2021)]MBF8377632.1 aldehyde dehydrogenase [Alicyclobacillus mali (ex Roth et al. 2021)]MCL6487832.1 aldehyde dehydrogenase family protein [Alicyclobacillus mali (ex Roth et al. 2021)]
MKTYQNYIAGTWQLSSSGETCDSTDPATGHLVARTQSSTKDDVERAVAAARSAFHATDWAMNSHARSRALAAWANAIESKQENLAHLLSHENGKPIREARAEIASAVDALRYNSVMARNVCGRTFQPSRDAYGFLMREPVGVVGVITPWNWPVLLLLRDLAPCLAAGNAAIIKPAERTGAVTAALVELAADLGLFPPGILQLVTGKGSIVGAALVDHPDVDMIAFTGSTEIGQELMAKASRYVKKVALELGGKSPNILFADCDLERSVSTACRSVFMTSGQICMAGSRLLVEASVYEQALGLAKSYAESLRVGMPLDESTDMGPVISETQLKAILAFIEEGRRRGRVIAGGRRLSQPPYHCGHFIEPTVIADVPVDCSVVQEEIFGPVLVVEKFESEEEAIRLANATRYGLVAGIWTKDLDRAFRVARDLQAGTVWLNGYNRNYAEAESGGYKMSGLGRSRGIEGLYEFTELKHIHLTLDV